MDNELVSNSGATVTAQHVTAFGGNTGEEAAIASIAQDFKQFDEDFGTNLTAPETASADTEMLDEATVGTPFAAPSAESGGTLSLLDMADGNFGSQEESLGSWLRDRVKPVVNAIMNRAQKIIAKMVDLARRLGKYSACVSKIVAAINAFKAKQYGSAISKAYTAFRCIQSA
tara:strand:- start:145 stop:660 length:516 start_codon:yes stop_codon:yes gene_type:complete